MTRDEPPPIWRELARREDRDWLADAECAKPWNTDLPWIDHVDQTNVEDTYAMAAVCWSCLVREQCNVWAEKRQIAAGFWAGRFREKPKRHRVLPVLPSWPPEAA